MGIGELFPDSERPNYGYQLIKELPDRSGGLYRARAGMVYPATE
jgi:DNA-binding PadR family transcriptional regulator